MNNNSWPPKKLLRAPRKVGSPKGGKARRVKVVRLKGGNFRLRTPQPWPFRPFRISAFQPYCDIVSSRSEPVSEVMRRDHVAWTASDLLFD
jgi:hypothetical protein